MQDAWARIVIVAYNSKAHLQSCIDALEAQTASNFEVVIVNNQSPDRCTESVRLPDERFVVRDAPDNLGFAEGCNFGARGATTPWIITLNPDAWPRTDWLAELISASKQNDEVSMLSSTQLQQDNPDRVDGFGDVYSVFGIAWRGGHNHLASSLPDQDVKVFGPCGAAAAYKREAFEALGGFDDQFFCYLEDVDLAVRMQRAGYECLQVRRAEVLHYGSGSTSKGSDFQYFQTYKNNLRLIIKNAPLGLLPIQVGAYALSQTYLLTRNRKRPGAKARWDGLKQGVKAMPKAFKDRSDANRIAKRGALSMAGRIAWLPQHVRRLSVMHWGNDRPALSDENVRAPATALTGTAGEFSESASPNRRQ